MTAKQHNRRSRTRQATRSAAPLPTDTLQANAYTLGPPDFAKPELREISEYVTIMFQGWDHLRKLCSPHYPKHDDLRDWYMQQRVRTGRPIGKRLAETMATIVRPPELAEPNSRNRYGK